MKLSKAQRKMLYQAAITEKSYHIEWSNHTCLEEAFLKCAGMANYNEPLESMLPEYHANPKSELQSYLTTTNNGNKK